MCIPTNITAAPRCFTGKRPSSTTGMVRTKKRRLAICQQQQPKKSVTFASHAEMYVVDKIANKYNARYLWYNRAELDRTFQMEVRRNLVAPWVVDTIDDELTWRGVEQYKPNNNNNEEEYSKRAHSLSHAKVIVDEYNQQQAMNELDEVFENEFVSDNDNDSVDSEEALGERLRFLSEALSKEDVQAARQLATEDQHAVYGRPVRATVLSLPPPPQSRRSSAISRTSSANNWMQQALTKSGSTWRDHFWWVVRLLSFFIFCGLFISN